MSKSGSIIILNGTSSSGKTTISKAMQASLENIYLHCALDAFWDMTPANIKANSENFPHMKKAMANTVAALALTGHNVVVDTIFSGKKTYDEFMDVLKNLSVIVVKVTCQIEVLKSREIARGDRTIGLAESQIETIHNGVLYDLEIDTSKYSPQDCVDLILDTK
jgi:chloramphenicol 3-O phosphotransferase